LTTTTTKNNSSYDWVYQEAAEMSALLGIKTPEVRIVGVNATVEDLQDPGERNKGRVYRGYGPDKGHNVIVIRRTRAPFPKLVIGSMRATLAHELLHIKYPKLDHGEEFEDKTVALVQMWKEWKESKK
jgi:hypothetical protein